jgi:ribosomal-protein-alanine N-acetyltransferase
MYSVETARRAVRRPPPPKGLTLERMSPDDVPAVMAVDRLCFPSPWSENAYRSEMGNVCAYYLVARIPERSPEPGAENGGRVIGFAGAWIVMDEAHVTTLGVHPDFRRHGLGERLLLALLEEARERGVRRATLEVRESNRGAQALYARLGFTPIARRRRYYSDTDEDAIVMWVEDLQSGMRDEGRGMRETEPLLGSHPSSLIPHPFER